MSKILSNVEAREKLLIGTKKIADAVLSTYGPNGHNVIISQPDGSRFITKDGVSVAKEISSKDRFENEAIQMLKEACLLTNTQAGDGTTTSMLFARTIIEEGFKSNTNGIILKRELEDCLPQIIDHINKYKRECTIDDIYDIAMVSTNGDKNVSELILKVFSSNIDADVLFDQSKDKVTTTEFIEGYSTDGNVFNSQYDYTEDTLSYSRVYTIDGKIDNVRSMSVFLQEIKNVNENIIIIAEEFSNDIQKIIYSNRQHWNIKLIKSPGYSSGRLETLENIRAYTGATKVLNTTQFYKGLDYGFVKTFSGKNNRLIFHNDNIENKELNQRIKFLKFKLDKSTDGYEIEQLLSLLSKFKCGISIINIGAGSEIEYRELHDKLEDAVNACKSALLDGIILGGGITAMEIADKIDNKILIKALNDPWSILNCYDKEEIIKNKIYDPSLVLKCAITNAIAVAGTILTTNTIIINGDS